MCKIHTNNNNAATVIAILAMLLLLLLLRLEVATTSCAAKVDDANIASRRVDSTNIDGEKVVAGNHKKRRNTNKALSCNESDPIQRLNAAPLEATQLRRTHKNC